MVSSVFLLLYCLWPDPNVLQLEDLRSSPKRPQSTGAHTPTFLSQKRKPPNHGLKHGLTILSVSCSGYTTPLLSRLCQITILRFHHLAMVLSRSILLKTLVSQYVVLMSCHFMSVLFISNTMTAVLTISNHQN